MDFNGNPDTKEYLKELIQHYDDLLNQYPLPQWVLDLKPFINEEKYKCLHQLRKIKEVDIQAMMLAKQSVSPFPTTNLT